MDKKKDAILEVEKIAALARIKIDKKSRPNLANNFTRIKDYFGDLSLLDLKNVSLTNDPLMLNSHADKNKPQGISTDFSDYVEENMFKVPKVID